ncbi:MAG: hypothetical protein DI565_12880 [Ancylobacter novellus]|uniref:Uncharacterized protein n=1 Tax=Ancylobacter novellus TaxID=921 RepID=A0A2W5KFS9_ANCNO|nr:MAG: hypothetical protein DI565_12880 [Ancylobacter novellus]
MTREAHDYHASVRRAVRALRRWDGESVADLKRLLLETVAAARDAGLEGYGLRGRCPHDVRWALGQALDNRRIAAGCSGIWNANDCRPATVDVEDASGGALTLHGDRIVFWRIVDEDPSTARADQGLVARVMSPVMLSAFAKCAAVMLGGGLVPEPADADRLRDAVLAVDLPEGLSAVVLAGDWWRVQVTGRGVSVASEWTGWEAAAAYVDRLGRDLEAGSHHPTLAIDGRQWAS